MGSPTCLTDPTALLVVDASIVINLSATGHAREILEILPNRLVAAEAVFVELEEGRQRGWRNADFLKELAAANFVEIVKLGAPGERYFEDLVVGRASETLDDGEAATIAYAAEHGAVALIDERKGKRICGTRFPNLRIGCTVDMFAHPNVEMALGREKLAATVLNALQLARMRVLPHHIEWVVELIGMEKAALCGSLPNSVRSRQIRNSGSGQ
jgi:predicted nucleic acid-binding protein